MKNHDNPLSINIIEEVFNNPHLIFSDIALGFAQEEEITYQELFIKIGLMAKYFLQSGVKSSDVVALILSRDHHFIICLLSLFYIGATVLPLEENYPEEKLDFILKDTKAKFILSQKIIPFDYHDCRILQLPYFPSEKKEVKKQFFMEYSKKKIAYIVYTSGTTGIPKRINISYENFYYYCKNLQEELNLTSKDIYAFTASIGFSSMFRQIFLPLLTGAKIQILSEEERKDPILFINNLPKFTIIDLIPSFQELLIPYLKKREASYNNIRLILSASEPLKVTTTLQFIPFFPKGIFINMYGLTESSGIVATYKLAKENIQEFDTYYLPIGKPINDTSIYLINEMSKEIPSSGSGEIGEICIFTPSLASDLIEKNQNKLNQTPNKIFYKTGDLGKYDLLGNLLYIGRSDRQIKISGKRIHLNEIDKVIEEDASVEKSVTVFAEQEKKLITFIKLNIGYELDTPHLKNQASKKLSLSFIPGTFYSLTSFPLTSSRKLDYANLIDIYYKLNRHEESFEDLTCEWEQKIYKAFCDQLKIKNIPPEINLFELGADSLKIALAIAKVTNELDIDIKLSDVFANPTIRLLALIIKKELAIIS